MNRALWTSIVGVGAAQLLKIPAHLQERRSWSWSDLFRTGGMPSSHAAGVVSLASYLGLKKGFSSDSFALATLLSLIVMFDAMGIRRHAGLIAMEVNELEDTVFKLTQEHPHHAHRRRDAELEERLGHMPAEVLGGAVLGAVIGFLSYVSEPSRNPFTAGLAFTRKWWSALR
ncbi:divergent PAP2 family protein [Paenibacillus validus]|uniref:Divergent PAP2 family protein n=1 Tax=Paenibacillus validus TaxID=44253 RepID=A0A7X3CU32_9BACL|nr:MULTISPECIES: divergent PAP2 family protein [Paenibacillus]MED4600147.1 divergent PAP2 family protein [Paenibacillus validus]MED4607681.1 divergent PAP2 family protein [Paenibacillus validus]MUG73072.1 divergent PAP2 family protein [Paenibacillus validus]